MQNLKMFSRTFLPILQLLIFLSAVLFSVMSVADNTETQSLAARLDELNRESARLVKDARSSQAKSSDFRIGVTLYRESLRSMMLDSEQADDVNDRVPQIMLVNMVRMSALLSSAAECRTGRYIVCPIELMTRLSSQQEILAKDLVNFRAGLEINSKVNN